MRSSALLVLLVALLGAVHGGILSNVFGSNMVLQRAPLNAALYGWSSANDTITINFNNQKKYTAVADITGEWTALLDPVDAGGPYSIVVISNANSSASVTLDNVLFGDVYLCGGQSNMQFTVNEVFNATTELANADNFPNVRLFTVGQQTTSSTPLNELATIEQYWSVASNATLGAAAGAFQYFSAVCWFTAVNVLKQYPTLPIGLVSSNWGGTIIQAWSSPDAIAQCPQAPTATATTNNKMAVQAERYAREPANIANPPANTPNVLWNAMIVPFLKMRLVAFLWYQAEANVGETDLYRCLFPAMINDWRSKWALGDIPFFFAQLAPYNTDGPLPYWYSLADMRLAQAAAVALPNVGLISTIDAGDTGSPFTNIHPRNKQIVGYRMSLAALSILYEVVPPVIHSGPTFESAAIISNFPNVNVYVYFLPTTIGEGLTFHNASCPLNASFCSTWELGLSDGTWHVGSASIVANVAVSVTLATPATAPANTTVTGVRYLYNDWPVATLYSATSGLPASPFYYVFIP